MPIYQYKRVQLWKTKNNTWSSTRISFESAKWHAWHVCVLGAFVCLHALHAWRAYMLGMLACLSASLLGALAWVHAGYDEMFYFPMCLRTWCAFLSYLLYISILQFKNSYSKKFACFVKLNIFLIYILIPTYKIFWNQLNGSRKLSRYII